MLLRLLIRAFYLINAKCLNNSTVKFFFIYIHYVSQLQRGRMVRKRLNQENNSKPRVGQENEKDLPSERENEVAQSLAQNAQVELHLAQYKADNKAQDLEVGPLV
jgi:hypothetical protein